MSQLSIQLPAWIAERCAAGPDRYDDDDSKMSLAIALAAENVQRGGGPFGAAVFAGARLLAAGVNCVLASGYSIAHAEILALMAAQQVLQREPGQLERPLCLATSAEPCCQCFGAVVWSGIDRLLCAASTADVEAIGFDEGPKPDAWAARLRERGIEVVERVQQARGAEVLAEYRRRGGTIYGLRHPATP